jgi:hypothetical protein
MAKKEFPKLEAAANQVLPAAPKGRPGASAAFKRQVCDFILDLFGKGVPLTICKQRAVGRFHISYRAVEYYWAERGQLSSDLDGAKTFVKDLLVKKFNEVLAKSDKSEPKSSTDPSSSPETSEK